MAHTFKQQLLCLLCLFAVPAFANETAQKMPPGACNYLAAAVNGTLQAPPAAKKAKNHFSLGRSEPFPIVYTSRRVGDLNGSISYDAAARLYTVHVDGRKSQGPYTAMELDIVLSSLPIREAAPPRPAAVVAPAPRPLAAKSDRAYVTVQKLHVGEPQNTDDLLALSDNGQLGYFSKSNNNTVIDVRLVKNASGGYDLVRRSDSSRLVRPNVNLDNPALFANFRNTGSIQDFSKENLSQYLRVTLADGTQRMGFSSGADDGQLYLTANAAQENEAIYDLRGIPVQKITRIEHIQNEPPPQQKASSPAAAESEVFRQARARLETEQRRLADGKINPEAMQAFLDEFTRKLSPANKDYGIHLRNPEALALDAQIKELREEAAARMQVSTGTGTLDSILRFNSGAPVAEIDSYKLYLRGRRAWAAQKFKNEQDLWKAIYKQEVSAEPILFKPRKLTMMFVNKDGNRDFYQQYLPQVGVKATSVVTYEIPDVLGPGKSLDFHTLDRHWARHQMPASLKEGYESSGTAQKAYIPVPPEAMKEFLSSDQFKEIYKLAVKHNGTNLKIAVQEPGRRDNMVLHFMDQGANADNFAREASPYFDQFLAEQKATNPRLRDKKGPLTQLPAMVKMVGSMGTGRDVGTSHRDAMSQRLVELVTQQGSNLSREEFEALMQRASAEANP